MSGSSGYSEVLSEIKIRVRSQARCKIGEISSVVLSRILWLDGWALSPLQASFPRPLVRLARRALVVLLLTLLQAKSHLAGGVDADDFLQEVTWPI